MSARKIIHCDCDCFYAAVEMRDNPAYASIPLAIGGPANSRGVIATCNYQAREYGVRSAMASAKAQRLCPELTIIPGRMAVYRQVSQQVMAVMQRYTDIIEPLSLDEAYLDVTEAAQHYGSATQIAERIRAEVAAEVGITISAGVAPNKFIAKVASDWRKPNGLFVVKPQELKAFAGALAVNKIPGVGPVSAERLATRGITTCADLWPYSAEQLVKEFGRLGESLIERRFGIDHRPVQTQRTRKSVSVETTFARDLACSHLCVEPLADLWQQLQVRWQRLQDHYDITGLVVKLKFADFTQLTREQAGSTMDRQIFEQLLKVAYASGTADQQRQGARLIGLGFKLKPRATDKASVQQLCLFQTNG